MGLIVLLALLVGAPAPSAALGAGQGNVRLTVTTPRDVPANVLVRAPKRLVLPKGPSGRSKRFRLPVRPGRVRVAAPRVTFNGVLYTARVSRRSFVVRRGRKVSVRVIYRAVPAARRLQATEVLADRIRLVWQAPKRARVQLRRTDGDRPARTVRQGTRVKTRGKSALDAALTPGRTYSYALFTRAKRRWLGPATVVAGTPTGDPTVATYAAPPTTVIVKPGEPDTPTILNGSVYVQLAPNRPTPTVGAAFVLPVSDVLPAGYLGKVSAVSPDGRTVQLAGAGLADAFDLYDINVDLATLDPIPLEPRAAAPRSARPRAGLGAGLRSCLENGGVGVEGSVALKPIVKPSGHFSSSIRRGWFGVPVGAKFDVSAQLELGIAADVDVSVGLSCALPFKKAIKQITVTPVPISLVFDPVAEVRIAGQMSAKNVGYTATGGFWTKGEIGVSNWVDGGLIRHAGPTPSDRFFAAPVSLALGGELTVGPGGGLPEVGAVAGVGGKFIPIKAQFGPVFGRDDLRHETCIETKVGMESELNLNAKAWVGSWEIGGSITFDKLRRNEDYGGPWYLPTDCEKQPERKGPSTTVFGDGITEVSSSTSGDEQQWAHVDGFAPGTKAWILATGRVSDASIDDPEYHASTDLDGEGRDALSALVGGEETHDAASYTAVIKPTGDTLHVRYVFASEEYPEYVGEGYDDVMAVFVDGHNCAHVPGTSDRVSVDSINHLSHSQYYVDNSDGAAGYSTSMDGVTTPLQCDVAVTPGKEVTVEIVIADTGDGVYDSAVGMLDEGIWSD
jgi:hypothetical protein